MLRRIFNRRKEDFGNYPNRRKSHTMRSADASLKLALEELEYTIQRLQKPDRLKSRAHYK